MSDEAKSICQIRSLRKTMFIQKDEVCAQIKREVADLEQKLLEQLDTAFWIKLVELDKLEQQARSSNLPVDPMHFYRSSAVQSLLSVEYVRAKDFECGSFAYINACQAKPEQLHFVEDYSTLVTKTGDMVRIYYTCSLSYEPVLFKFLSTLVKDAANNIVVSKNSNLEDGRYMLEFKACEEGSYFVYVKVYGQNISGSPVVVNVRADRSMSLPELTQSRVEATFTEPPQYQVGGIVLPQDFINTRPGHLEPVAEEGEEIHNLPRQATGMTRATLPKTRIACEFEAAVVGQSAGSNNSSQLCSMPVRVSGIDISGQWGATPSRGAVQTVLDGAAQEEGMDVRPVTRSCRRKSFTKFEGTVSADLVLQLKAYSGNDCLKFPIGISATAEGNIIVGDTGKHRVIVFDAEGRPLCMAALPGSMCFKRPSAIVALEDGSFAVKDDKCIYLFSKAGEFIRTLGKETLVRPFGLASHEGSHLVTLSISSPAKLWRFSAAGDLEDSAVYSPLYPLAPTGSKCRFLDVHEDCVFMSDLGLSQVYKTNLMGEAISTFGKMGTEPGAFHEPSGISATDKCLFIGDSKNNRIQVSDFDGNCMKVVNLSSPITRPSGIHVSANKLYVLSLLHGIVGVYNLKYEGNEM